MIKGLNIPFTYEKNIKSILEVMMFGRGSAFDTLPQVRGIVQGLAGKIKYIIYGFILDLLVPIIENQKNIAVNEIKIKNSPGQNKNLSLLEI